MASLFSLLTLFVLTVEIIVYLLSLVSPTFLRASQRRTLVKTLRGVSKVKNAQFIFSAAASIVAALFAESLVALVYLSKSEPGLSYSEKTGFHYQIKVLRAEKHFITSLFTVVMALVVFMRLREKNNYIKLLEKYESKPEGEDATPESLKSKKAE
ncbi:hypothetical protein HK100_001528 [Physocladia obscura]|uniref:Uncharacterized protein n=1 Tax=Physocladia obscura TaxID=109957 RepID=A0AAD5XET6_9FUNG|nr:hypothetical protein HK100_001528 [Physocladia obscura]